MRTTFCNSCGTILLVAIIIFSCENNDNKDITYPAKSKFGMNLLSDSVSEILNYIPDSFMYPYPDYSLTAILESESSLKVIISKEGDCSVIPKYGCTFWLIGTRFPYHSKFWSASTYNEYNGNCTMPNGHVQVFTAKPDCENDLIIRFAPVQDLNCSIKVEIFENGSLEPTRTKHLKYVPYPFTQK
jgi:hypothetical protein